MVRPGQGGVSGWKGGGSRKWGESVPYILKRSGLWDTTPEKWREIVLQDLTNLEQRARSDRFLQGRNLISTLNSIHGAQKASTLVEKVRLNLAATAQLDGSYYPKLTWCMVDDLDADLRYLGCENGVVDLRRGKLLPPNEGRKRLVTYSTGVKFDPGASHPDVGLLFSHLDPEQREWYWSAMAHALHGRPSRRIYLIVGPKGAGKTQMGTALVRSLGQYAEEPMDSALSVSAGSGQHNTELAAFARPVRVCLMDEANVPKGRVSPSLMKRLSGDGRFTFRRLHENPQTREATATLFLIANPLRYHVSISKMRRCRADFAKCRTRRCHRNRRIRAWWNGSKTQDSVKRSSPG